LRFLLRNIGLSVMKSTIKMKPRRNPKPPITDRAIASLGHLGVLGELNLLFHGSVRPKGTLHLPK
jgi:hypothetical protein